MAEPATTVTPPTDTPVPSGPAVPVVDTPVDTRRTVPAATVEEPQPNVAGGAPERQVWRPDLGGTVGDLLGGLDRGVHQLDRLVPRDLGGADEPLSRLVPLLLALLGAFLALQRGIGTGMGHVPMVAAAAPREPVRP